MDEILQHLETIRGRNLQGNQIIGFLGWCELDFVHPQYGRFPLESPPRINLQESKDLPAGGRTSRAQQMVDSPANINKPWFQPWFQSGAFMAVGQKWVPKWISSIHVNTNKQWFQPWFQSGAKRIWSTVAPGHLLQRLRLRPGPPLAPRPAARPRRGAVPPCPFLACA